MNKLLKRSILPALLLISSLVVARPAQAQYYPDQRASYYPDCQHCGYGYTYQPQSFQQWVYLTSNGSRINVRVRPTVDSASPHYGLPGDCVWAEQRVQAEDGYEWFYVSFPNSGAEGWVRGDLVTY